MLRGYLGFLALVWAGIGLVLLVMPEALEGYAGVRAESGVAKAELRAMYGGLSLAVAMATSMALIRACWQFPVLFMHAVLCVGLVGGRLAGLFLDDAGSPYTYGALSFEVGSALISILLLRKVQPAQET
ncbi:MULTISPECIES: DUF4345 family protein [Spongiibacter]|uniref:DUF4345 family protein n=1 Tax=Spongiibacter TaxID=630749 RepID=UPI000C51C653|nr:MULTISPECIES: DUF4345 family protein [Spongiibacter]MAY39157.1 hypothetical protein [Spongiibacter sp.]MBI57484.1 hypothetical protein [Spongiibacter sp.]MBO6752998.1 DUF4345 family protein [Spongiibacter sp.]|tara:strand:- start:17306 stop:17692 length:387 start_codon:yes stop_codon:yes gene_type:complete